MSTPVDGRLLPQNDFDIPLNLANSQAVSGLPVYHDNGRAYPITPAVEGKAPGRKPKERAEPVTIDGQSKPTSASNQQDTPKPKRVRTGCLTCRERHLKCDENFPRCKNCQKSDRQCKRGVRLNFIDTQIAAPPYSVPSRHGWQVNFHDESREIASEYVGGFERYPSVKEEPISENAPTYGFPETAGISSSRQSISSAPFISPFSGQPNAAEQMFQNAPQELPQGSGFPGHALGGSASGEVKSSLSPPDGQRVYLNTPEEVLLMQVYVEEIGLWMDSLDPMKHFTHILPFHALNAPMLLNAFLACGARHLFLVNPSFGEDKALYYYNISTRDLLSCLQNPNRDTVLCATTAVVLNVYEIMCEKAMQRMNHIAGARALIRECKWSGRSTGLGSACFWLNVGMELLSCLHFNWKMAWDPDAWGVDMDMRSSHGNITGDEELWTHRMLFICAKLANYRASAAQYQSDGSRAQDNRLEQRCEEWMMIRNWCDEWLRCVPRSMLPLGYLPPWQTTSKSSFPEIWIVKRSAVVARLFYHTTCCLLAKVHPTQSEFSEEMLSMQHTHAHDICGIVAHVKDRGVASVSIRCLAIAAECLVHRQAQEEVIRILDKIIKETGWQVTFLQQELIGKWGWDSTPQLQQHQAQPEHPMPPTTSSSSLDSSLLNSTMPPTPSRPRMPQGIVNPLMATADFSSENHPYQNYYVAPQNNQMGNYHYEPY